jgi:hypothetical protein
MTAAPTPTDRTGWIYGQSDTEYHVDPALNSSFLRALIVRSPGHARAAQLAPREETPALLLGRAVHARILEPETFKNRFAVAPQVDRRTNAGKAAWAEFAAAHPGAEILSESDGEIVAAIGAAVDAHPLARLIFRGGEAEVSGFFTDPETGAPCRIRPDYLRLGDQLMVDLKTTLDASPREFERSIAKYGYHIQAAHYAAGYRAITGEDPTDFLFVAVEKAPPYAIGIYRLDDDAMAEGARVLRRALNLAARCLESGHWPAYSEQVEPIGIPKWAYSTLEDAA